MPVCSQGFFVSNDNLPQWMKSDHPKPAYSLQYLPCNYTAWCEETHGLDCAQQDRSFVPSTPEFGARGRLKTGLKSEPPPCMMIELWQDAITHFQYLSSFDNTTSSYYRYSPTLPYGWKGSRRNPWNAFDEAEPSTSKPYTFEEDRQGAPGVIPGKV